MLDSSPEEEDFPGRLLHQAALWDNADLLEDLLMHGDQLKLINSHDSWGRTPIHAAAINDKSKCLRILLEFGANPNIQCGPRGDNKTALHLGSEHGHDSNIRALLEFDANILLRDANGMTAYDIADKARHEHCLTVLKEAADAKEKNRQEVHTALRNACIQGSKETVRDLITSVKDDIELLINMAPSGANTVLFIACQVGKKEVVKLLLDHGADGRVHPVTKYSPLYIACYHGHKDVVELLLLKFPELVQEPTVEKWLPIHAACINGHIAIMDLLLRFPYPAELLKPFTDASGQWQYSMPFDINAKDVSGQNVLYVACLLGNIKMVEVILNFRVVASRTEVAGEEKTSPTKVNTPKSPTKRPISSGIQSILSKLNLRSEDDSSIQANSDENLLSPIQVDLYCNYNTETACHAAVKGKHLDIVFQLLQSGANASLPILVNPDLQDAAGSAAGEDDHEHQKSNALVEACRNRDTPMVDLLLKYGARDDDCKALKVTMKNKDEQLITKLLSIKAHPDPEFKINKKSMTENIPSTQFSMFSNLTSLTYSSLFPNVAVMINWHNQQCSLTQVRKHWLIETALHLNPKLKQNPRSQEVSLYAITRLDVSNNSLTSVPLEVFQLPSLRYLNLAQNKIERLPVPQDTATSSPKRRARRKSSSAAAKHDYGCLVLEEMYLQDNRLDRIPEAVFRIPSLVTLVVSNNKLQELPYAMWQAPNLKELNAAFNMLKDLPTNVQEFTKEECDRISVSSSDSRLSNYLEYSDTEESKCMAESDHSAKTKGSDSVSFQKKDSSILALELTKHNIWSKTVEVAEQFLFQNEETVEKSSQLSSLNLAHNLFTSVPPCLPCLAVNLTKLNMAYNSLRTMSYVTNYPNSLKQLDLSHNRVTCWPSLPQVDVQDVQELACLLCYSPNDALKGKPPTSSSHRQSSRSFRNTVMQSVCTHRRHLRLDNLRTLILADNELNRIQLTTIDDGMHFGSEDDDAELNIYSSKSRLIFPNLSMLDISNNNLRDIPTNIHELNNLSVLNLSGNSDIYELPPEMGLLSRLWNLNTRGCSLQEPLKSMIESNKYKTMDIIGYLKSVLEDAKPYARMKLMIVGIQGIGKTSLLEQLRMEGTTRKKPSEHWTKRMGNKNVNVKTPKGINISTVGVDIGDWVYEKKSKSQVKHGPVVFRTWDFGGQKEYYATHQYFLSKRSLYLVVWRILDGYRGINEILQWLVNIQARAPNSPVLIIGTHYDMVHDSFPHSSEELQQVIRDKFINIVDAEKCGLPRVIDTIEISCRTRHNIKLLCNLIYDTVFSLKSPGSKELLLEQKVPASYLALEDIVTQIATERKSNGFDPVLTAEQYRLLTTSEMMNRFNRSFRDWGELHQATLFLHDNGVLLHYDDATLKDLYFLDPQWLCDMLAHVVTIREINPFARTGIMKLDDLKHIFKASSIGSVDTKDYIVNLLNKFEVALTWDSRTLLIPSLLPSEEDLLSVKSNAQPFIKVKIPLRSRGWAVRNKKITVSPKSVLYSEFNKEEFRLNSPSHLASAESKIESSSLHYSLVPRPEPELAITRLLLMSYFPSGFWSRLMARILADDSIIDIVRSFFEFPKEILQDAKRARLVDQGAEWCLWQTGLQLKFGDITLFRMREILHTSGSQYRHLKLRLKQEGVWCDVDLSSSSILEIHFPIETLLIKPVLPENISIRSDDIIPEAVEIKPSVECTTQLLALAVDHVDILLEDWYPTLGTRFVHTSEGKFLVTRLIPCPKCLIAAQENCPSNVHKNQNEQLDEDLGGAFRRSEYSEAMFPNQRRLRQSQESYTSDGDSGVGPDSANSSRKPSVEGHNPYLQEEQSGGEDAVFAYSWMVEECILAAYGNKVIACPIHSGVSLSTIAPDTIFMDLGEKYIIRPDNIKRGRLLGRGAFGFVFKGTCKSRGANNFIDVAMKMLQPVQPGPNSRQSAIIAYKAAQGKWDRDPLQYACKAYCTARQELNILLTLRHPNIVPLVGICLSPLALVLDLAPQGALDTVLKHYRRSGARVGPYTMRSIILQVAKAIEYLHRQRIIYRDLKSENVLVWNMPPPFQDHPNDHVLIKVADYGISRSTLPSGSKGFGGTEGFMAPEIMRYNGEEEYTEKVDCFSFGMFIYELLTLHQPFEGHESVKECILEGTRPPLTARETDYPTYILDLMVMCWSQQPRDRPSASQIVSIASAPEFTHLCDVTSLKHSAAVIGTTSVRVSNITDDGLCGCDLWILCANSRVDILLGTERGWLNYHGFALPLRPTAICSVDQMVWIGDCGGNIHAFSASDGSKIFSYSLEVDMNNSVEVVLYLPSLQRVACGLSNGRLFLVDPDARPTTTSSAEGTFVMSELGSSTSLFCLCAVVHEDINYCELWCGGEESQISVFAIKNNVVAGQEVLAHFPSPESNVLSIATDNSSVWSYVQPGCVIYQWCCETKTIINKLNCLKLVPCSESLMSIAIEEHLSPSKSQVSSLTVVNGELYIGTTWGCIIIAECSSMRPITVFRPFEEEVRSITAMEIKRTVGEEQEDATLVVCIGKGYRHLLSRFTDFSPFHSQASLSCQSPAATPINFYELRNNSSFALLWKAEHWDMS